MKHFFFAALTFLFFSACSSSKLASAKYEVIPDSETKILKGALNRSIVENDTAFGAVARSIFLGI